MRLVILPHKGEKEVDVDLTESVVRALQTGAFVVMEADGIKVIFFLTLWNIYCHFLFKLKNILKD